MLFAPVLIYEFVLSGNIGQQSLTHLYPISSPAPQNTQENASISSYVFIKGRLILKNEIYLSQHIKSFPLIDILAF